MRKGDRRRRTGPAVRGFGGAWLLLLVLAPTTAFGRPGSVPPPTALVHVAVVDPESESVLTDRTVLVRGGRIEALGPSSSTAVPEDARVVEGAGLFLAPGLVDAHVHLDAMVGARPDFGDAPLFLARGVTTVVNLRGDADTLRTRALIEAGDRLAPTLYTSGEFVNEPRVHTVAEAEREVAAQAESGFDVIKFREVIDFEEGRVATTRGLEHAAFLALNDAARRRGIPVVGHAPYRVGLDGLLEARMSLAHSNELANLHFLPPLDLNRGVWMGLLRGSLAALSATLLLGGLLALVRRVRSGVALPGTEAPRTGRLAAAALLAAVLWIPLWIVTVPPGRLYGHVPLLVLLTLLGAGLGVLGLQALARTVRAWAKRGGPWPSKMLAVLQAAAVLAVAAPVLYWTVFAWRGSPGHVRDVARRLKASGIWVQSTLVLYETGMGAREGYRPADFKADPLFPRLAPEIRQSWAQIPRLVPPIAVTLWGRHPEFVRSLVAALHREGVPLMAGTDAMGAPFIFPGESLHRELALLRECGLTPREVLWTATLGPARFLGREAEFGTVAEGKRADLLLLDGDPTRDLSCLRRPVGVMVRGRYLSRAELDAAVEALR